MKCPYCIKTFTSKTSLDRHIAIHLGKVKLHFEDVRQPEPTDERPFKYSCKICSKKFTYRKSYVSHKETHEEYENENGQEPKDKEEEDDELPRKNLQCSQCGKLFKNKRNLSRHISTHSNIKFNCSYCDKVFSRSDKLKEHANSSHKKELYGASDDDDDLENEGNKVTNL